MTSIVITPLENADLYGGAEYSIDNVNWQNSNVFENLEPGESYLACACYKGNDTYEAKRFILTSVTTLKDGAALIKYPEPITIHYLEYLRQGECPLPEGWSWEWSEKRL